jgi:hypothetical protein
VAFIVATEAASGKGAGHRYMVGAQIVEAAPHQVCRHQTVVTAVVVGGGVKRHHFLRWETSCHPTSLWGNCCSWEGVPPKARLLSTMSPTRGQPVAWGSHGQI